jgi:hypothetical protein
MVEVNSDPIKNERKSRVLKHIRSERIKVIRQPLRQISRNTGPIRKKKYTGHKQMAGKSTHMKKEAVSMSPTETIRTASEGYHSTGTGLEIAFAACDTNHTIHPASAQRARKQNP